MRKAMIGLLLAATAAAPALADKGGKGHDGSQGQAAHGGGPKAARGGGGHAAQPHAPKQMVQARAPQHFAQPRAPKQAFKAEHRGGGWKAARGSDYRFAQVQHPQRARQSAHRGDWQRRAYVQRPTQFVRASDKHAANAWKQAAKQERKFQRAVARQEGFRPAQRWAAAPAIRYDVRPVYVRPVVRYVASPAVRYAPAYAPVAYANYGWADDDWPDYADYGPRYAAWGSAYDDWNDDDYAPLSYGYPDSDGYWPTSYDAAYAGYPSYGQGLFGGGDGLLGALLPVLLQSIMGSDLGGLGGLAGLGSDINVLPLQQASYAPYLSGGNDLTSLLLPSLIGSGSGFF